MSDQQSAPPDPDRGEPVMTNHINLGTNAEQVNGGVQQSKPSLAQLGRQDSSEAIDAKPKSTFKITSVTLHPQKGASQDGRHSFGEEEDESAVEDSMVHAGADGSPTPLGSLPEVIKQRQDRVDSTSRFKVVKIQQKRAPYNAGRWRISEFMSEAEPPANKVLTDSTHAKRSDSGNSSRASSNHYVHGVDDPSKNPLVGINNVVSTNPSHPGIQPLTATQAGLPVMESSSINIPVEGAGQPAARTEHIENNSRLGEENMHVSSGKDPHLIGGQPSNHVAVVSDTNRVPAAGAPGFTPSSNHQHSGVPVLDQGTAQHNTQNVAAIGSSTSHAQQAPTALPSAAPVAAAGSSSDSQSSAMDNQQSSDNVRVGTTPVTVKPAGLLDIQETSGGVEALAANLTELVDPSADGEKAEDADATATGVAIDNKIELAMDLVKSHLMLAVREEVEDLKLQIKQLIERNSQLEQENKLLKSSAAPETMAQLTLLGRQQNH